MMMDLFKYLLGSIAVFSSVVLMGQSPGYEEARMGNKAYLDAEYQKALNFYDSSLTKTDQRNKIAFNKGNSLYRQKKFADAATSFEQVANTADNSDMKAKAFHNLGNSKLQSGKIKESIEAYKNALRLDPSSEVTRYNLAYAKRMLKKKKDQQQKNDQKKNQDKKNNKNKKDQQKKDKKNKDQQGDKKDNKGGDEKEERKEKKDPKEKEKEKKGKQNKEKGKKKKEQPNPSRMSKKDAKRLLKALEEQEKGVQKKVLKKKRKQKETKEVEKDW